VHEQKVLLAAGASPRPTRRKGLIFSYIKVFAPLFSKSGRSVRQSLTDTAFSFGAFLLGLLRTKEKRLSIMGFYGKPITFTVHFPHFFLCGKAGAKKKVSKKETPILGAPPQSPAAF